MGVFQILLFRAFCIINKEQHLIKNIVTNQQRSGLFKSLVVDLGKKTGLQLPQS